jgi:predicted RNA binding protein YcfA (HicA-like mRNA interferase family)
MKVRDVIKRIETDGWYYDYTEGSLRHFRHPTKPGKTTVSGRLSVDIPTGTLA